MSETPFLGELRLMSFNFPPRGWALCNGQMLAINQNQALFSLLGTTYGGNGQTTFALPDLRGRTGIHRGAGFAQGQAGGAERHTVSISELPPHTHTPRALTTDATTTTGKGHYLAGAPNGFVPAAEAQQLVALDPASVTDVGGSQPHENRQPHLVLNWCIALQGIFPSQN